MKKVLYITYDGILEPLGYSQILSYLIHLSKHNYIKIISVEKKKDLLNVDHFNKINNILKENNIKWKFFNYADNKFGKTILVSKLLSYIFFNLMNKKINIVHARSYITGLLVYILKFFFNFHFIFDIRGFWIDERIDWGLWRKKSIKYIFFRFIEKKIYNKSNTIVTLTNDSKNLIYNNVFKRKKIDIFVIPTCLNIENKTFLPKKRSKIKFTHLGAIGSRYNFLTYINVMKNINNNSKFFLSIINKGEHDKIKKIINDNSININNYEIKYVYPYDIDKELRETDFGLFFPVHGYYLNAYFPTKLGEFLSNGVPVITNKINKHVDQIIIDNNVGIVINDLNKIDYNYLSDKINLKLNDKDIRERCKSVASKYLDIRIAIKKYSNIYNKVI